LVQVPKMVYQEDSPILISAGSTPWPRDPKDGEPFTRASQGSQSPAKTRRAASIALLAAALLGVALHSHMEHFRVQPSRQSLPASDSRTQLFSATPAVSGVARAGAAPLAAAWAPQPLGNCTSFAKESTNCDSDCGNCFNPGARAGMMCRGQQPGYNCPSDPNPNGDVAFACMDWTFGSHAQRAAEASYNSRSGKDPVYFGVGTYGTSTDAMGGLGMCVLLDVEGVDRAIVAQSINTGFDVAGNQFDLQIGAGGAGAYNTCVGDPHSMYPGSKAVWGKQYGGLSKKAQCSKLPRFPRDDAAMRAAGDDLVTLCEYGFDMGVRHEGGGNPTINSIKRVACPAELVNLTQLWRSDEPTDAGEATARRLHAAHKCGDAPGLGAAWCLTRMMDCRKPSGGFKDNVRLDHVVKGHRLVQPCTADGYTRMDVQCGCNDCYC